jgi:hypothetical protein
MEPLKSVEVAATPRISVSGLIYKTILTWEKLQNEDGGDIDEYTVLVDYSDSSVDQVEKVTGDTATIWLFIPGDSPSREANISISPFIEGLTGVDTAQLSASSSETIVNEIHCMLPGELQPLAEKNICPKGSIFGGYSYACKSDVCVKKPYMEPLQPAPGTLDDLQKLLPLAP